MNLRLYSLPDFHTQQNRNVKQLHIKYSVTDATTYTHTKPNRVTLVFHIAKCVIQACSASRCQDYGLAVLSPARQGLTARRPYREVGAVGMALASTAQW